MISGLMLTQNWREDQGHLVLEFWVASDQGPQYIEVRGERSCYFLPTALIDDVAGYLRRAVEIRPISLKQFDQQPVSAVYFNRWSSLRQSARELQEAGYFPLESDIKPTDRFLMERRIRGVVSVDGGSRDALGGHRNPTFYPQGAIPTLKVLSLDIETDGNEHKLLSIGVATDDFECVWLISDQSSDDYVAVSDERACIEAFLMAVQRIDPDVITGWNVVDFDLWVLSKRAKANRVPFTLGRRGAEPQWREDDGRRYCHVSGRSVIDAMRSLATAGWHFSSRSLQFVSHQLLGEGKLIGVNHSLEDILNWYQHDPSTLARYNLKDCTLVLDILEHTKLLQYLVQRACLTGAELDRIGGSVAQFDFMYLPELHRSGYVATHREQRNFSDIVPPGGWVMASRPGLYRNVLVLDFKSLYPSIIRSFCVDPCALWEAESGKFDDIIPGFDGASFVKHAAILPAIIEALWAAREAAKAERQLQKSNAIKILMNSCYGVLGSTGCRFFDPRLAGSITKRGHEILQRSSQWINDQGHEVIYGDTDSVFVLVSDDAGSPSDVGRHLASGLNDFWTTTLLDEYGATSCLEIEFETHFSRFFMPTIRDQEVGSKKRYAGLSQDALIMKGLEAVRSDWTPLAQRIQRELFLKVFHDESWDVWLKQQVTALMSGELNHELVYRKRIRKPLSEYQLNVPPHIRAAKLASETLGRGDWIEYVVTLDGVKPWDAREEQQLRYDYEHYLDRQLAPAVDSLLQLFETSLSVLVDRQIGLFS